MPRDIKFNSGFSGCEDRMAILRNEMVPRDLESFEEVEHLDGSEFIYVDQAGEAKKIKLASIQDSDALKMMAQSDWNELDPNSPSYILNKPAIEDVSLTQDITALYTIGGIKAGNVLKEGESVLSILKKMLTVEGNVGIWQIISNTLPLEEELPSYECVKYDAQDLVENGLTWDIDLHNQLFILIVQKGLIEVTEVTQGGWPLELVKVPFNTDTCNMYYFAYDNEPAPSTGKFRVHYSFGMEGK